MNREENIVNQSGVPERFDDSNTDLNQLEKANNASLNFTTPPHSTIEKEIIESITMQASTYVLAWLNERKEHDTRGGVEENNLLEFYEKFAGLFHLSITEKQTIIDAYFIGIINASECRKRHGISYQAYKDAFDKLLKKNIIKRASREKCVQRRKYLHEHGKHMSIKQIAEMPFYELTPWAIEFYKPLIECWKNDASISALRRRS